MTEYQAIKEDKQIWKFCFYGFFKNLKFFEPYLLIYLLGMDLNLMEIGFLFAIREAFTYIFEVPSGIIADHYGKKKELLMCFVFYIISFVFFFLGENMILISMGMIFLGLGEAFRSGTHKAMILTYLEHKNWYEHKGYVYGRTRSYSLIGSSISAFLSILLVLNLPALRWIFLVCIIPYIVDFILIMSYPEFLDERKETEVSFIKFWKISILELKSIWKNKKMKKIMVSASIYDGVFKTVKDYIQPIMITIIGIRAIGELDTTQSLKMILGIIYGVFYIFSSLASRNIFRITKVLKPKAVFDGMFDLMGIILILLSFVLRLEWVFISVLLYFALYLMMDARRPVFLDVCGDEMERGQRATVLSVESQIRALLMIIMAPLFGWIATNWSISLLFLMVGILTIMTNRILSKH